MQTEFCEFFRALVAMGIPLLPPTLYAEVKHHRPLSKSKVFGLTSRHRQAIDSGPRFYVSSERQGRHTEQKLWKQSHMDLPIPDSNLQPSSHKSNALQTELPGLPRPWSVLGWVTVTICQFLLIVLWIRLLTKVPWGCSFGDSMNFPLGLIQCNFHFSFLCRIVFLQVRMSHQMKTLPNYQRKAG